MPEVILPCPACGKTKLGVFDYFMVCKNCGVQGPTACNVGEVIPPWNALPRALRWTHEPPKVAGWYWHHMPPAFGTVIEFFDPEISKAGCGEWAGPIAPPIES